VWRGGTDMKRIYKTTFHAAHHIKGSEQCGMTHGHSYRLVVKVHGDIFKFVDFHDIKEKVDKVVENYDHKDLGNMTCENLSAILHQELSSVFNEKIELELYETDHFGVFYC